MFVSCRQASDTNVLPSTSLAFVAWAHIDAIAALFGEVSWLQKKYGRSVAALCTYCDNIRCFQLARCTILVLGNPLFGGRELESFLSCHSKKTSFGFCCVLFDSSICLSIWVHWGVQAASQPIWPVKTKSRFTLKVQRAWLGKGWEIIATCRFQMALSTWWQEVSANPYYGSWRVESANSTTYWKRYQLKRHHHVHHRWKRWVYNLIVYDPFSDWPTWWQTHSEFSWHCVADDKQVLALWGFTGLVQKFL